MAGFRYIADPEDQVRAVVLDGLIALFHAPSGMTHIVAPPAPEILAALREGPATIAELIARLGARYDFEEECGAEAVAARLAELEQAGLVQRA
jgi:PqqD family protein of HPr-rel-A system